MPRYADVTDEPLPVLPQRPAESHKGDFGRVLIVGGSRGKAGAIALTGKAVLRSGAGLVTIVVPRAIQDVVAGFEPSYMTQGLGASDYLDQELIADVLTAAEGANCVGLGPGLGAEATTFRMVHAVYRRTPCPLVVDADALNAMAAWPEGLHAPDGVRILTPHPGEFRRLTGKSYSNESEARAAQAVELCRRDPTRQTVVVLKGHRTLVTDGDRVAFNPSGNPGMATGGCGDVLTGVLAALVGQGLAAWEAARLGVYLHGLAGDLAAAELGQTSLIASDLLGYLPRAFRQLEANSLSDPAETTDR